MILNAGFGSIDITPPTGLPMDGYIAREGVADGVLDRLHARCLTTESNGQLVVIIVLEVVAVGQSFVRSLRDRISVQLGCPPHNIMIAASHTHSGPRGFQTPNSSCAEYVDETCYNIAELVKDTSDRLEPTNISMTSNDVIGISASRIEPGADIDRRLSVVQFRHLHTGQLLGVLANFPCHPTVLGFSNLRYSGDFFGQASRMVEDKIKAPCMLTNGAEGDISTRFTRHSQSYDEVVRLGNQLGREILLAMSRQPDICLDEPRLHVASRQVSLPVRPLPSVEEAVQKLKWAEYKLHEAQESGSSASVLRQYITRVEGAQLQAMLTDTFADKEEELVEIMGLRIGPFRAVGAPGEAFSKLTLTMRRHDRSDDWFIVGLANDYRNYFPDLAAYDGKSYEALRSPYSPEVLELLKEACLETLHLIT